MVLLPQGYPNYKTVHRRFQQWCRREVLRSVLMDLANKLRETGRMDERESFIDGMFVLAKGGGEEVGYGKRGKGMNLSQNWISQHPCDKTEIVLHEIQQVAVTPGWPIISIGDFETDS